jgi:hypothetical protein
MIVEHIRDGMDTMMTAIVVNVDGSVPSSTNNHIAPLVVKIVTFLIVRIEICDVSHRTIAYLSQHTTDTEEVLPVDTIRNVLHTLLQLRGFVTLSLSMIMRPILSQVVISSASSTSVTTHTTATIPPSPQLFSLYETLLNKIDICYSPTIRAGAVTNDDGANDRMECSMISSTALACSRKKDISNNVRDAPFQYEMTLSIGQVHALMTYFGRVRHRLAKMILPTTPDRIISMDSLLEMFEALLLHILPTASLLVQRYQNYHPQYSVDSMTAVKINFMLLPITTILSNIVSILIQIEEQLHILDSSEILHHAAILTTTKDNVMGGGNALSYPRWTESRFYQRLMHWVLPTKTNTTGCGGTILSLGDDDSTIQVLAHYLDIAHIHYHKDGPIKNVAMHHLLLTFMIQLLFDDRTNTTLRHGLSCVFIRLLSHPSLPSSTVFTSDENTNQNHVGTVATTTSPSTSFVVGCSVLSRVPTLLEAPTLTPKLRKNIGTTTKRGVVVLWHPKTSNSQ